MTAETTSRHIPHRDIGVVGVNRRRAPAVGSGWSAMDDYAELLASRANLRALPLPLTTADPGVIVARLRALPSRPKAVLLVGFDAGAGSRVRRAVEADNGPVVVTEVDAVTAALGAAVLTLLQRHGAAVRRGRIVITGTPPPKLGPLLARLNGIISSWHTYDAEDFPLRQVMACHDVLIDLAGVAPDDLAPEMTITAPESAYGWGSLVLPGLLRGLCAHPHPSCDVGVLAACARGVALVTPADRLLPCSDERLLATSVAHHVKRALPLEETHDSRGASARSAPPNRTH